jgi:hypothetical protein
MACMKCLSMGSHHASMSDAFSSEELEKCVCMLSYISMMRSSLGLEQASPKQRNQCPKCLMSGTWVRPVRYFLGISIHRNNSSGYSLSQPKYVQDMLHRFGMTDATTKPAPLPVGLSLYQDIRQKIPQDNQYQAFVGFLIYLAADTRPDISHAVGILSRFMACPTDKHWEAAKHVLRYLKGTPDLGLLTMVIK